MRNPRGISGVVIAVLLTVIGILAVLMFWGMFSGMFNPQPKVIIEKASITKVSNNKYDVSITVREVGGASTTISKAVIIVGGDEKPIQKIQNADLQAGQSKTLVGEISENLEPGTTYYIAVYYKKGGNDERSELYPVTVR
ncbi:hypothetical protein [Pyrobaculum sp.]|uniref:hypothetical protein n=1 Tax=Pyrobaculum sp. TaxID=2004705 RepID=UPI003D0A6D59